jgi:hypothetical protein
LKLNFEKIVEIGSLEQRNKDERMKLVRLSFLG